MDTLTTEFSIGNWEVSSQLNQLRLTQTGQVEVVTPKVMALLVLLVEHHYSPVSLDGIAQQLWPERIVSDSSIYQAVAQLRKVLNKDPQHSAYIEQISAKGYRIAANISINTHSQLASKGGKSHLFTPQSKPYFKRVLVTLLGVCLAAISCYGYFNKHRVTPPQKKNITADFFESITLAEHLLTQTSHSTLIQAKQLYQQVLSQDSQQVAALYGLCETDRLLYLYSSTPKETVISNCTALLNSVLQIDPKHAQALALLASIEAEQGHLEKATQRFSLALKNAHHQPMVFHWYGMFLRKQKKITEALNAHKHAFSLAPNNPEILVQLAYAYLVNREQAKAKHYFERGLTIAPNLRNAPLYALDFYHLTKQRARDYLIWHKAFGLNQSYHFAAHQLTHALFQLSIGQVPQAKQTYQNIHDLDSVSVAYRLYGEAAFALQANNAQLALAKLKQRYLLAPTRNHYVMPYIQALVYTGDANTALSLFITHFKDIVQFKIAINNNPAQYLTYAHLLHKNQHTQTYKQVLELITRARGATPLSPRLELQYQILLNKPEGVERALDALLTSPWLPDYTDNIFEVATINLALLPFKLNERWSKQLAEMSLAFSQTPQAGN